MEYRRLYPDRQDIDAKSYSVKKSMWAILSTERQGVLSNEKSNENKTYVERTMKLISYIPYISEYFEFVDHVFVQSSFNGWRMDQNDTQ